MLEHSRTHLMQRQWLLRLSLAVEPSIDSRILAHLLHAPRVRLRHCHHQLQVFAHLLLRVLGLRLELGQVLA